MNLGNQDFTMLPSFSWQREQHEQEQRKMEMNDNNPWAMSGITYPGKHDVMLGRGGESNYHTGNLTFRAFIQEHKERYQKARKQEKPIIALEVVLAWRDLTPPGRFLTRTDPSRADSLWEDVGDDQACKRAGRTLGEKSANKASLKQHQLESSCGEEGKQPSLAMSADEAASSVPSSVPTKTARRNKRPKVAMDYIAAFRSQQLADDTVSAPANKRCRTFSAVNTDFVVDSLLHKKNESALSPPTKLTLSRKLIDLEAMDEPSPRISKHMSLSEDSPFKVAPLDIGTILDDEQMEQPYSLRESLPTAEFLTRCLDF